MNGISNIHCQVDGPDYLAGFGRYGIPFNVVYGPGAPEGRTLPELLTGDAVLAVLDGALGG